MRETANSRSPKRTFSKQLLTRAPVNLNPHSLVRVALLAVTTVSCGLDPLRLTERRVSEKVSLRKFPDDTYYVVTERSRARGAMLAGSLSRIGWNDTVIVAERRYNKVVGWVRINPVSGDVSDAKGEYPLRANPALFGLQMIRADSAWAQLPW
jgi:hypothetical protein